MKVKELIELLKQCPQEISITVFDDESRPYEIESVIVCDEFSHIILKEPEGSML